MKGNTLKTSLAVFSMLFVTIIGYSIFYNKAFSGTEYQGTHIWLSADTVQYVNHWLKEGPISLKFMMYGRPDSIEYNVYAETPYLSYPPGFLVPVYVLAKLRHKTEIQLGFIKAVCEIKFLIDALLVCMIFYSIFSFTLKLKQRFSSLLTAVVLALAWMCLPINLYYLRNIYYADQCIITIVLLFILLEIYDGFFWKKTKLKYLYMGFKFFISLYGVLTEWYFLFVLFVSWLTKIVPLCKREKNMKKIFSASAMYVLPVFIGVGLFIAQITNVQNYQNIIINKIKYRIGDNTWNGNEGDSNIVGIIKSFIDNYMFVGFIAMLLLLVFFVFVCLKKDNNKILVFEKYRSLMRLFLIICVPPIFQVLVFQQHSAIHEYSLIKFGLPFMFSVFLLILIILEFKQYLFANIVLVVIENTTSIKQIKLPLFNFSVIAVLITLIGFMNYSKVGYFANHIGEAVSYEREHLIRNNYNFNDVYFSFTEEIQMNPPMYHNISKKLIYKIDDLSEISKKFTDLDVDARLLFVINKNIDIKKDYWGQELIEKSDFVLGKEENIINNSKLLYGSENYNVYELRRLNEENDRE